MDHVPLGISQNLHFDMTWTQYRLFQKYGGISKGGFRFAHRGVQSTAQLLRLDYSTHSASATAGDCLDEEGEADLLGFGEEFIDIRRGGRKSQYRNASSMGGPKRLNFIARQVQDLRG